MRTLLRKTFQTIAVGLCLAVCSTSLAQEEGKRLSGGDEASQSWYEPPSAYQPNPRAIIHAKALARSSQRAARLASLSWYGMYNGRPTAAPTPFTSMYSPTWQQPGGRPFAWYANSRPTYVFYR